MARQSPYIRITARDGCVDLRTVQEPEGWKTLNMVQRYAHLAPERLIVAVERMVLPASDRGRTDATTAASSQSELRQNSATCLARHPTPVPLYRK